MASIETRRGPSSRLLRDTDDVIRALARFNDPTAARSTSLMMVPRHQRRGAGDAYGFASLSWIEEHAELVRRLRGLDRREREMLLLCYTEDRSVAEVAELLGISRVHGYRLRRRALERMTSPVESHAAAAQPASVATG
ncbi:MAG: sigma factor-like helix-turn-helix DNA-binding protein [Actinomycetota bacterium]